MLSTHHETTSPVPRPRNSLGLERRSAVGQANHYNRFHHAARAHSAATQSRPEIKTGPAPLTSLLRLPDSAWERQIKAFDDKNFRLGDFHGKVVVINLWASWCGPCRREVPEYERVRKAYPNGDVVFIGLTAEDPRRDNTRVRRFVREVSFGFRLGWIDDELMRTLSSGSGTIPQTLVMNRDGRIISHWDGYMSGGHSGERLKQTIEQALKQD